MRQMYRPRTKDNGLVCTQVAQELVIYHEETETAHALSEQAVKVWLRCDGTKTVKEIIEALVAEEAFSEADALRLATSSVKQFFEAGLLDESNLPSRVHDRRDFIELAGKVAMFPVLTSVLVPKPAAAQSSMIMGPACCTTFTTTITPGQCNDVDGCCCSGVFGFIPGAPDVVIVCDGVTPGTCATDCTAAFGGTFGGNCSGV